MTDFGLGKEGLNSIKVMLLPALFSSCLTSVLAAQTCREVIRDSCGWIVQTIDRQKITGGSLQAITRDASGRIAHQLQALGIPHLLMVTRSGKRAYDPRKPQVNILSVQSSKGFDFRSVIFIGLGQIETSETQSAQNMNLLYVGMTRAKEWLLITASGRLTAMTGPVCAVA